MAIYAKDPYTYAYNWRDGSKKYGKIIPGTELIWIADAPNSMFEIKPVADEDMLEWAIDPPPSDRWFVMRNEVTNVAPEPVPEPEPLPEPVGEISAAECVAFVKVARYILGG